MERLSRIRVCRENLQDLQGLFRALRGLAASHMVEAEKALAGVRHHIKTVERAIGEGARLLPPMVTLGDEDIVTNDEDWLIAVCSEHGFTAGLNDRVLEEVKRKLEPGCRLGIVGRRGGTVAEEHGLRPEWVLPMASHVGGVAAIGQQVAGQLLGVRRAGVIYTAFEKGGLGRVEVRPILPLAPEVLAATEGQTPLHHLAPVDLMAELADEYLFAEITHALMEALGSENGARLQVMQGADTGTKDKLAKLMRQERHLRQEAITSELLELATGVEAVRLAADAGRPPHHS